VLKIIRCHYSKLDKLQQLPLSEKKVAVAIGKFEAIHLGHQSIIDLLPDNHLKVVLSFYPNPVKILKSISFKDLYSATYRGLLLDRYNVDVYSLIRFTPEFAKFTPEDFLANVVLRDFRASYVVVGRDAKIGKDRSADAKDICSFLEMNGCKSIIAPFLELNNEKISTRRIRNLIESGLVDQARLLLGRPFSMYGRVIGGDKRGQKLGFPTANLYSPNTITLPTGVYATKTVLLGKTYDSVTNIGFRPTFGLNNLSMETHILNYIGNSFYNEKIEVLFYQKIRDEIKFSSLSSLKSQITKDIILVKNLFTKL
jgi:riboflavin kinase / FMN adenylyltransferase